MFRKLFKTIVAILFGILLLKLYVFLNLHQVFSYDGLVRMTIAGGGLAAVYYYVIEKWLFKERDKKSAKKKRSQR